MDIQIQVKGIDELVRNLRDLGVNRIPNYVARALTEIANQAQDAMIADAQSNLVVRGSWLTKGTKFGINRKAATKNDLTAVVSTIAPWLIEQETKTIITPRQAGSLAVPFIWQRGSRLAVTKSPKRIQNTIKLKGKVRQRDHLSTARQGQAGKPCPSVHPTQAHARAAACVPRKDNDRDGQQDRRACHGRAWCSRRYKKTPDP